MQLDDATRARLDSIVESEVALGFRLRPVPEALQAQIRAAGLPAPEYIRLSAINPARRRDINKLVQQRYHRDLKDDDVLSDAEIQALAEKRGEWSTAKKKRMDELQELTTREMGRLWAEGFSPDTATWANDIVQAAITFKAALDAAEDKTAEEKEAIGAVFDRWLAYLPERHEEYTAKFAAIQGREVYSVDADFAHLLEHAPDFENVERLNEMDELKDKQRRLIQLTTQRLELQELQLKHARIFAGSAESKQQHNEELAQLYYTCHICDAHGVPKGHLAPTFDALWEFPDEAIRWMLYESYFYHNEVPDEARDYLSNWGFMRAGGSKPASGESAPSAESHAPPPSKTDTEPVAATA